MGAISRLSTDERNTYRHLVTSYTADMRGKRASELRGMREGILALKPVNRVNKLVFLYVIEYIDDVLEAEKIYLDYREQREIEK